MSDSTGVTLIQEERHRQVYEKRWTLKHDDQHTLHELAYAAAVYAVPGGRVMVGTATAFEVSLRDPWPWPEKPKFDAELRALYPHPLASVMASPTDGARFRQERIRELTKAGALIAAEIDRLTRLG